MSGERKGLRIKTLLSMLVLNESCGGKKMQV